MRGAPKKVEQAEGQEGKYFEEQANAASPSAQLLKDETDKLCRRFDTFFQDELPVRLVQALENAVRNETARSMRHLHDSVHDAACRIQSCSESLARISWNGRLILTGIASAAIGGCLVRYAFYHENIEEAKRYERFGRKVEENIERYKPKDREKLYNHVGGRP